MISEFVIEDLFGKYSYRASSLSQKEARLGAPPLMLLYGDNGSGKTTILRLLWDLFSPAHSQNHRYRIANTPFRKMRVRLGNGHVVTVSKPNDLVGNVEVVVKSGSQTIAKQNFNIDEPHAGRQRYALSYNADTNTRYFVEHDEDGQLTRYFVTDTDEYVAYLRAMRRVPVLLADDRRMHSDSAGKQARNRTLSSSESDELKAEDSQLAREVHGAIRRANAWLQRSVLSGTEAGSERVEDVYRQVTRQLAQTNDSAANPSTPELIHRLESVEKRAKRFSEFGIFPKFEADGFIQLLSKAPEDRMQLVASVLDPYISAKDAQLDKMEPVEQTVRSFVDNLNGYLNDKHVSFTVQDGLAIFSDQSDSLFAPQQLSSGERQLLLLMCNALLARNSTNLFLIDEPELSLNAKWQRTIVDSLLDCVRGANVQFIMATHSVEIITRHRSALAKLAGE